MAGGIAWVQRAGRFTHGVKKQVKIWETFKKDIMRFSLSTFPTGGDTVRGECEFSRYMLILIVLVPYNIDIDR